jgi:L-fuconolactonase
MRADRSRRRAGNDNDDNNDYVARGAARHPDRLVAVADIDCNWRPEHHATGAADRLRAAADRYGLVAFTHYLGE